MLRSTALLSLALLLGACSNVQLQGTATPDIRRECARLLALQAKLDEQMAKRRRDLALTILKREELMNKDQQTVNLAYSFRFCRGYLGLPPVRVIRVPKKADPLEI